MTFEAPGGAYTMEVEKGHNMSQIGGDGWARFLARMHLTGGELISFNFRAERLKLAVIYLNLVEDDEDDEDDENPRSHRSSKNEAERGEVAQPMGHNSTT